MWILIVVTTFVLNNGQAGGKMVSFQEFATRNSCNTAGHQIVSSNIKTICVPK